MREIKFRAWASNLSEPKMVYDVGLAHFYDGVVAVDLSDYDILSYEKNEIMQFTGLKDKNGKEIYEGDILKEGIRHGTDTGLIYKVVWFQDDTHNGWNIAKKGIRGDEIIGNIYENPDLAGVAV